MKKSVALFLVFILFFSIANLAFAVEIKNPIKADSFPKLLTDIADVVGTVVASVAVLMFIVAGIFFLISAGNPNMITRARTALGYAIVGLVVGLAAKGIVLLIEKIIGVPGT